MPEERPNSGLISDDFGNENLPGVDFEMFDVTDVYYNLLKDDPRTTDIDDDGLEPAAAIALINQITQQHGLYLMVSKVWISRRLAKMVKLFLKRYR